MDTRRLYVHLILLMLLFFQWTLAIHELLDDDDDEEMRPWNRCQWIRNALKNGRVKIRSRGRIAKFMCDPGYELAGKRYATCVRGQWNNPIPVCVSRGCSRPPDVANGRVTEMYRGAVIMYDCFPGYTLEGTPTVYCDGRLWSSKAPNCIVATANPMTSCDFEDKTLCGWSLDPSNDFDWKRNLYSTPSGHAGTGPSFDHTFGDGRSGYYLYMEASSPRKPKDKSRLFSPVYSHQESGGCFQFWYHMFGYNTGGLKVYVKPESHVFGELVPTWTIYGEQENSWLSAKVNVEAFEENFQIIIEGERGNGYLGDTAIDDVYLVTDACESLSNSTAHVQDIVSSSCRGRCREINESDSCSCTYDCTSLENCCSDFMEICTKSSESAGTDISGEPAVSEVTPTNSTLRSISSKTADVTPISFSVTNSPFTEPDSTTERVSGIYRDHVKTSSSLMPHTEQLTSATSETRDLTTASVTSPLSSTTETSLTFYTTEHNITATELSTAAIHKTSPVFYTASTLLHLDSTSVPTVLTAGSKVPTTLPTSHTQSSAGSTLVSNSVTPPTSTSVQVANHTTLSTTNKETTALSGETNKLPVTLTTTTTLETAKSETPSTWQETTRLLVTSSPRTTLTTARSTNSILSSTLTPLQITTSRVISLSSTSLKPTLSPSPTSGNVVTMASSTSSTSSTTLTSTSSIPSETRRIYNLRPRNRTTASLYSPFRPHPTAPITTKTTSSPRPTYRYIPTWSNRWVSSRPVFRYTVSATSPKTTTTTGAAVVGIFKRRTTPASSSSMTEATELNPSTSVTVSKNVDDTTIQNDLHHSKSASTASGDRQPIVTIVSLSVALILCLVGGLLFYMKRMKARKQSKLADDSEMRFLSENETVEYSDPTVLDRVNYNPPLI